MRQNMLWLHYPFQTLKLGRHDHLFSLRSTLLTSSLIRDSSVSKSFSSSVYMYVNVIKLKQ